MEDSTDEPMLAFTVSHAGQTHRVEKAASSSLLGLRQDLQEQTGVAPFSQKIILKGKTLPQDNAGSATLSSLGISNGSKLLMVGSKASTVQAFVAEGSAIQQRFEASKIRPTAQLRKTATGGKTVMNLDDLRRSSSDAFGTIEVLAGCPFESLRKDRLDKLSKDEAVLDSMRQREWTVGLLTELHPHKDPTLLGLNRNAGEAIYLRLLTDDLSGLRSYNVTRMVLLHELTHNRHGDHDEHFKALNSLLNKEVKAFEEAKRAGAHRLGGDIDDAYDVDETEVEQMCGSTLHGGNGVFPRSASSSVPKSRVREEEGAWEQEQKRQAILRAAERRRNEQA